MTKSADAFRTISEVAEDLDLPQHVLRFWETRFLQIKPLKRAGGRRFYRPADVQLLVTIRRLLYDEGYTIKGVQRLLKEQGARARRATSRPDGEDDAERLASAEDGIDDEAGASTAEEEGLGAIETFGSEGAFVQGESTRGEAAAAADRDQDQVSEPPSAALPPETRARLDPGDLDRLRVALGAITACEAILRAALRPDP